MTLRRLLAGAAGLLAVGLAAHGAVWWFVTGELERQAVAVMAQPPLPGWRVSAGPAQRGGWPLAATVALPDLVAVSPDPAEPDRITWRATRLTATLALARPRTLVVEVEGPQSLAFGTAPPIPFAAALTRAEVALQPDVPVRAVTVEVADLAGTLPAGKLAVARLDLRVETRPAAQQGETAASVVLASRGIDLPQGVPWPLGPRIASLALEASVSGPVPRDPDIAARAEAWRDGGGALTLRTLELAWGDVTLGGGATLALDARLQPMGAATLRLAGFDPALRALVAAGVLPQRTAMAAGAVLALMARRPAEGGPPSVEVPLGLQDRTLSLGRIPLIRLPELIWRPPE